MAAMHTAKRMGLASSLRALSCCVLAKAASKEVVAASSSSAATSTATKKQLQTVELKVRMDCEGCELKVRKALSSINGVKTVDINMKQQKVTVTGYIDPKKVLKKAQATGKKAEIWPYVPYSEVNHPYSAGAYDKKAPPGYVRKLESSAVSIQANRQEDQMTNMFSDENPNSCNIM